MRLTPVVIAASSFVSFVACGSKLATSGSGTGPAGGTGASGGNGGTVAASSGTGTTASAGTSGATTAQSSGSAGAGGATTTTTASTGGATTTTSGAGGSCATTPKFTEVLSMPLSGCSGLEPPCHNAGAGGMTINTSNAKATWKQLVNVPATIAGAGDRVVPGDPAHSFLYRKLTNDLTPSETPPMPEQGGIILNDAGWQELPAADIEMVRCWILGGALNN